ncbi:hypothetical protein CPB86DRAFT_209522 [Serendipita vermifera]|nr:hypothetical protein CPB86DRAFT_209522 [Serendipita vermifera]
MSPLSGFEGASLETLIGLLVNGVQSLQDCRYTSAAAATIYVYDIFLTFDVEVELVWTDFHITIPNILYILNRYICLGFFLNAIYDLTGFRPHLSESYCRKPTQVIGFILAHLCWTSIMALRVTALWTQNKPLVRLIWILWVCTMCAVITIGVRSYIQITEDVIYSSIIDMCVPTKPLPRVMAASPIASTIYELLVTILTIIKTYQHIVILGESRVPPLLRTLSRDGVMYFIMSTTIAIANIFCWNLFPPDKSLMLLYLYWGGISTLISRLVLNLRFISRHSSLIDETGPNVTFNLPSSFSPTMEMELPSTVATQTLSDMDERDPQSSSHGIS